MDEQELAVIEAGHASTDCDLPVCWECGDAWPCTVTRLVAEIRRLQPRLDT